MQREEIIKRFKTSDSGSSSERWSGFRGDHNLNPGMELKDDLIPAAVLVPLVDRPEGLTIMLTQRTAHLNDHAGQISFPGGRVEPEDPSHLAAALREAEEEVGLPPDRVDVIGVLDPYIVRSGYRVTPVVGFVNPPFDVKPDPFEVADVFEVPLTFVLNSDNHETDSRTHEGTKRTFYVLPYEDRYIWGATAGMLVNLSEVLVGP
ncbi:MAG: CoA pyrophosphatase [Alphaproteobacteria bacterium]|nr:CoA pyrophosphatase [Alphaproteobacteria bacterium]